jgi:hypothetical protein
MSIRYKQQRFVRAAVCYFTARYVVLTLQAFKMYLIESFCIVKAFMYSNKKIKATSVQFK